MSEAVPGNVPDKPPSPIQNNSNNVPTASDPVKSIPKQVESNGIDIQTSFEETPGQINSNSQPNVSQQLTANIDSTQVAPSQQPTTAIRVVQAPSNSSSLQRTSTTYFTTDQHPELHPKTILAKSATRAVHCWPNVPQVCKGREAFTLLHDMVHQGEIVAGMNGLQILSLPRMSEFLRKQGINLPNQPAQVTATQRPQTIPIASSAEASQSRQIPEIDRLSNIPGAFDNLITQLGGMQSFKQRYAGWRIMVGRPLRTEEIVNLNVLNQQDRDEFINSMQSFKAVATAQSNPPNQRSIPPGNGQPFSQEAGQQPQSLPDPRQSALTDLAHQRPIYQATMHQMGNTRVAAALASVQQASQQMAQQALQQAPVLQQLGANPSDPSGWTHNPGLAAQASGYINRWQDVANSINQTDSNLQATSPAQSLHPVHPNAAIMYNMFGVPVPQQAPGHSGPAAAGSSSTKKSTPRARMPRVKVPAKAEKEPKTKTNQPPTGNFSQVNAGQSPGNERMFSASHVRQLMMQQQQQFAARQQQMLQQQRRTMQWMQSGGLNNSNQGNAMVAGDGFSNPVFGQPLIFQGQAPFFLDSQAQCDSGMGLQQGYGVSKQTDPTQQPLNPGNFPVPRKRAANTEESPTASKFARIQQSGQGFTDASSNVPSLNANISALPGDGTIGSFIPGSNLRGGPVQAPSNVLEIAGTGPQLSMSSMGHSTPVADSGKLSTLEQNTIRELSKPKSTKKPLSSKKKKKSKPKSNQLLNLKGVHIPIETIEISDDESSMTVSPETLRALQFVNPKSSLPTPPNSNRKPIKEMNLETPLNLRNPQTPTPMMKITKKKEMAPMDQMCLIHQNPPNCSSRQEKFYSYSNVVQGNIISPTQGETPAQLRDPSFDSLFDQSFHSEERRPSLEWVDSQTLNPQASTTPITSLETPAPLEIEANQSNVLPEEIAVKPLELVKDETTGWYLPAKWTGVAPALPASPWEEPWLRVACNSPLSPGVRTFAQVFTASVPVISPTLPFEFPEEVRDGEIPQKVDANHSMGVQNQGQSISFPLAVSQSVQQLEESSLQAASSGVLADFGAKPKRTYNKRKKLDHAGADEEEQDSLKKHKKSRGTKDAVSSKEKRQAKSLQSVTSFDASKNFQLDETRLSMIEAALLSGGSVNEAISDKRVAFWNKMWNTAFSPRCLRATMEKLHYQETTFVEDGLQAIELENSPAKKLWTLRKTLFEKSDRVGLFNSLYLECKMIWERYGLENEACLFPKQLMAIDWLGAVRILHQHGVVLDKQWEALTIQYTRYIIHEMQDNWPGSDVDNLPTETVPNITQQEWENFTRADLGLSGATGDIVLQAHIDAALADENSILNKGFSEKDWDEAMLMNKPDEQTNEALRILKEASHFTPRCNMSDAEFDVLLKTPNNFFSDEYLATMDSTAAASKTDLDDEVMDGSPVAIEVEKQSQGGTAEMSTYPGLEVNLEFDSEYEAMFDNFIDMQAGEAAADNNDAAAKATLTV